jgi:uroporphyrinogen III methyltransferase/synthase
MAKRFLSALTDKRVVITRAAAQSEQLAQELSARGAIPIVFPLVAFAEPEDFGPLDAAIERVEQFEWMILTSAQTVRALTKRSEALKRPLNPKGSKMRIACVGPVTAEVARGAGLAVDHIAGTHNGVALAEELGSSLQGRTVILPRSDRANPDLPAALKRYGASVTEVIAYRTVRPTELERQSLGAIAKGEADAILFFSPSAVQHFVELFGPEEARGLQEKLAITAVGPITANALRAAGVERGVVAGDTTATAVIEALEKHFAGTAKPAPAGVKLG